MQAGKCFCGVTVKPADIAELTLLCQILTTLNPMATCDVPTLMDSAKCFCAVTNNPLEKIKLQLLCEIKAVSGTGGGGVGQVLAYTTTDPNTDGVVPPTPANPAIAVKPGGSIFTWTTPAGPWV